MKLVNDFHSAILANNAALIAPAIKSHPRLTPAQQFAVYADGYRIRLVQAIRSDYPILLGLIGECVFYDFARDYIEKYPPANYNLDYYPHKFAEFISESCDDKFACELAILEGAIAEVFMLPDSEPLAADSLTGISAEDFGAMILRQRTACRLLQFSYPVSDWLTLARTENNQQPPSLEASWLLMVRHNNEVQRHNLSEQEFCLLQNLFSGKNVSDALEATLGEHELQAEVIMNNLQKYFTNWLQNCVFRV